MLYFEEGRRNSNYIIIIIQVSETMAASSHQQQNGQVIGLGSIGTLENDPDTKLFVVKKTGDSQGITALISRQLQGKNYQDTYKHVYMFMC